MIIIKLLASLTLIKLIKFKEMLLVSLSLSMPLTLLVATATVGYSAGIVDDIEYKSTML